MSSLRDQLLKITRSAFEKFGELTPESVIAYRSADCVHRYFPASIGMPARNNQEQADFIIASKAIFPNYHYVIQEDFTPLVDEVNRTVLVHVKGARRHPGRTF